MNTLRRLLGRLADDGGQTLFEYGVVVAWIALLVVVGATTLGNSLSHLLSSTAGRV